jgi:hypothetical protein
MRRRVACQPARCAGIFPALQTRGGALLLLLLLSCHKDRDSAAPYSAPPGDSELPGDDGGDDSGDGSGDSAHDSGPGDTAPPQTDFVRVGRDEETWSFNGYVVEEWQDTSGALGADGLPASFTWMRPAEADASTGLLIYLHGSTAEDDGDDPSVCDPVVAEEARYRFLNGWGLAAHMAMQRGLSIVAPLDRWCDVWLGRGEEDEVGANHYGWDLLERSARWAIDGHGGVQIDGPVVAWGTSTGAIGAALAAARIPEVQAAVLDSGPIDFYDRTQTDFSRVLDHVLGGDPEEATERYAEDSPVALVQSGEITVPLLIATNAQDVITAPVHGENMRAALAEGYSPAGLRWGYHDFNHPAPGDTNHVQLGMRLVPWAYSSWVVLDFLLEGHRVQWVEAELDCPICEVGELALGTEWTKSASGGAAMLAPPEAGPGRVVSVIPPSEIPIGADAAAIAVLGVDDINAKTIADDTLVARLRWTLDGAELARSDVAFGDLTDGGDLTEIARHISVSRLEVPGGMPASSDVRVEVEATGEAPLLVDAVVFTW